MNRSRPHIPAIPMLGLLAFIVLAIAALLMVAERAGLPTLWVERIAFVVIGSTLALATAAGRTVRESDFFGYNVLASAPLGGAVLAISIVGATSFILPAKTPSEWLAVVWGASIGVIATHIFLRIRSKGRVQNTESIYQHSSTKMSGILSLIRGIALVTLGFVIAATCLSGMRGVLLQIPQLASWKLSAILLALPVLALVFGGLRGSITLTIVLAVFAIAGLAAMIGTGLVTLGEIPLPGLSETNTLLAVQEARARWLLFMPPFFETWPALSSIFSGDALRTLAISTVVSAAIAFCLAPAVPVRRRSLTLVTVVIICLIPISIMAVGGYAIEAAGMQFVDASIVRPPAGLLEAARLGIASVCGGYPETAEALRVACGVSPRDAAAILGWQQVKISQEFLRSGLPVAQGYPTIISVLGRCIAAAITLSGVTVGLWIAAKGLGQGVLARQLNAPGLASLRLALTRLAVCFITVGLLLAGENNDLLRQPIATVVAGIAGLTFLLFETIIWWQQSTIRGVENTPTSKAPRKKGLVASAVRETV